MQSQNIKYLVSVDQTRGLAALWIFFYHVYELIGPVLGKEDFYSSTAKQLNPVYILISEGHTAVALFMVLSGFIFTWGAYGKKIVFSTFIYNRLLRIYPLYIITLIIGFAAFPNQFTLANFFGMMLPLSDFISSDAGGITAMSWAIGVEFQFYLIFPLLFLLSSSTSSKRILGWICIFILLRILMVAHGGNPKELSYWHLSGRIDQFLLGMLTAYTLKNSLKSARTIHWLYLLSIPLVVFIIIIFHSLGGGKSQGAWLVIWPTIEGGLWSLFVFGFVGRDIKSDVVKGKLRSNIFGQFFQVIGQRSYSIYLLHFSIVFLFRKLHNVLPVFTEDLLLNTMLIGLILVLPLVLIMSELTWNTVEKPFLNLRKKYLY